MRKTYGSKPATKKSGGKKMAGLPRRPAARKKPAKKKGA